jgi:hypothetical protein
VLAPSPRGSDHQETLKRDSVSSQTHTKQACGEVRSRLKNLHKNGLVTGRPTTSTPKAAQQEKQHKRGVNGPRAHKRYRYDQALRKDLLPKLGKRDYFC